MKDAFLRHPCLRPGGGAIDVLSCEVRSALAI
jgi:hypothetical protein